LINLKNLINSLVLFLAFSTAAQAQQWTRIENGRLWTDTNGNSVQAHGGNFLQVGDVWYLVGEDRTDSWNPDVNLYSTRDFRQWKFEGKIIGNGVTTPLLGRTRMIERPKLMRCPKTGKFVVWCHWEAKDYGASEAAVFQSDSVGGPYQLVWAGRPMGVKSRDCNVFVDTDGAAYFISTTNENQDLGLFALSDDYTRAISHTPLLIGQRREAPALAHVDSLYYMISSACTGWVPNQAQLTVSATVGDGWQVPQPIGDNVAYRTQASSILRIEGTEATAYIYVGDRWMDPDLPSSKIIMFPIELRDGQVTFEYRDKWEIDLKRGVWRDCSDH